MLVKATRGENDVTLPVHPTARDPRTGEALRAIGVLRSGRIVWPIAGGGPEEDAAAADKAAADKAAADAAAAAASGSGAATFTQEDLNREAGRRAAEAKRAAVKELAEKLGMTPDEAAQFIADKRAADEAAKSEEQKRLDAIAKREADADARDAKAADRERAAAVREALAEAGSIGQELKDAAVLITAGLAADADDDAIKTAVEELKKRRGELFKGTAGGTTGTSTGTGSGGGTGTGGGNGGAEGKGSSEKLNAGADKMRELSILPPAKSA